MQQQQRLGVRLGEQQTVKALLTEASGPASLILQVKPKTREKKKPRPKKQPAKLLRVNAGGLMVSITAQKEPKPQTGVRKEQPCIT